MKKYLLGFLLLSLMTEVASAANCLVQLRTYDKTATPDSVFYPVGVKHLELPQGKRFGIFVQWESKSQFPYLLDATVEHVSGKSVDQVHANQDAGSVRVDTVKLGLSTFSYKINGRADGKPLNIPNGCESGSFTVEVVSPKKMFDVNAALSQVLLLENATVRARIMATNEGSWITNQIVDLAVAVRSAKAAIQTSGGDVLLVETQLNDVGSRIANLRSQAYSYASYQLQTQLQTVENEYMALLQIVAP